MNRALKMELVRPDVREKLSKVGAEVDFTSPQEFQNFIEADVTKWESVRDKAGLEPK
jgi:tripartite-type tricarboxylate transporter receptor subunit TctC